MIGPLKTLLPVKLSDLVAGNLACEIKVDSISKNLQMSWLELFDGCRRQTFRVFGSRCRVDICGTMFSRKPIFPT